MAREKREYTEEQKAAALAEVEKVGIHQAAKNLEIPWQTVTRWAAAAGVKKAEDKATANAIERKKNARSAGRKAREKAGETAEKAKKRVEKAADDVKETAAAVAGTVADHAAGRKIGTRRKVKEAGRKAKDAITAPVERAIGDLKDAADKAKLADEIEKGKKQARRTRKKEEGKAKVEERKAAAKTPARKRRAAKLNMTFQSPLGGAVTPEEIAAKVPKEATDVYIRIDENRIYWVSETETGSVDIW